MCVLFRGGAGARSRTIHCLERHPVHRMAFDDPNLRWRAGFSPATHDSFEVLAEGNVINNGQTLCCRAWVGSADTRSPAAPLA